MGGGAGDDHQDSRWHEPPTGSIRRAWRLGIIGVLLAVLAVAMLLTAALLPAIRPIVAQVLATSPPAVSVNTVATQYAAMTPTSADWYTFKVWGGGFQVDVPGVIGSSHGYYINGGSGQGVDLYYLGAPLSSALQRREAKIWVSVLYSARITDDNICPQGGVAVTVGSGKVRIPAWVRDEGRIVVANLVLNGRAIELRLDSRDSSQPALADYGDIWQHILASFAPLPEVQHPTTRPCG